MIVRIKRNIPLQSPDSPKTERSTFSARDERDIKQLKLCQGIPKTRVEFKRENQKDTYTKFSFAEFIHMAFFQKGSPTFDQSIRLGGISI
tara:strand:- start:226 stop:495 length:270 start_codon:yes stop_codon:yes gene_type:complete